MNYIAVKRAKEIHKPDVIKFWINKEPMPSPYWAAIEGLVEINTIPMDGEFQGVKIEYPQLQSDVTRLEILHREGGIYMDTDMFLLKDLSGYMDDDFSMCLEPSDDSACNALLISKAGSDFTGLWLDQMAEALQNKVWAYGGVIMPFRLYQERPDLVMMHSSDHFCPFGLDKDWLFSTDPNIINEAEELIQKSTAVHGFETFFRNTRPEVSGAWCRENDSLFSRIVHGAYDG
jgi:hypothetical protein